MPYRTADAALLTACMASGGPVRAREAGLSSVLPPPTTVPRIPKTQRGKCAPAATRQPHRDKGPSASKAKGQGIAYAAQARRPARHSSSHAPACRPCGGKRGRRRRGRPRRRHRRSAPRSRQTDTWGGREGGRSTGTEWGRIGRRAGLQDGLEDVLAQRPSRAIDCVSLPQPLCCIEASSRGRSQPSVGHLLCHP